MYDFLCFPRDTKILCKNVFPLEINANKIWFKHKSFLIRLSKKETSGHILVQMDKYILYIRNIKYAHLTPFFRLHNINL